MEGTGIITRDSTINPPHVRNLLKQIGNEPVSVLTLVRTPLSASTKFLLNIASFGQLQSKLREIGVDKLFHLSMSINNKYEIEKNEVIKMQKNTNVIKQDSETLEVPIKGGQITIQQMLDRTQSQMGKNYGSYDAVNNNCSVFISNILSSNNLNNANTDTFLNQKTEELFKVFPKLTEILVKGATTVGAVVDRQIQGEGKNAGYFYNNGYPYCKILI